MNKPTKRMVALGYKMGHTEFWALEFLRDRRPMEFVTAGTVARGIWWGRKYAAGEDPAQRPKRAGRLLARLEKAGLAKWVWDSGTEAWGWKITEPGRQAWEEEHKRRRPVDRDGNVGLTDQEWSVLNRERGLLVDKKIAGTLTVEESVRLEQLHGIADRHIDSVRRRVMELAAAALADL